MSQLTRRLPVDVAVAARTLGVPLATTGASPEEVGATVYTADVPAAELRQALNRARPVDQARHALLAATPELEAVLADEKRCAEISDFDKVLAAGLLLAGNAVRSPAARTAIDSGLACLPAQPPT